MIKYVSNINKTLTKLEKNCEIKVNIQIISYITVKFKLKKYTIYKNM